MVIKAPLDKSFPVGPSLQPPPHSHSQQLQLPELPGRPLPALPVVDIVVVLEFLGPVSTTLTLGRPPGFWQAIEAQRLHFIPKAWPQMQQLSHWVPILLVLERGPLRFSPTLVQGACYRVTNVVEKVHARERIEYHLTPTSEFQPYSGASIGSVTVGKVSLDPVAFINEVSARRDPVLSISDLFKEVSGSGGGACGAGGAGGNPGRLFSFEGLVMVKGYRFPNREYTTSAAHFETLLRDHGIGLGRPDKVIHLRARDLTTVDAIDLYLDLTDLPFPYGLLPGRIVQVRRVQIKLSAQGHCYATVSSGTVISSRDMVIERGPPAPLCPPPLVSLFDLYRAPAGQIHQGAFQLSCRISFVHFVSLRWTCTHCGHTIVRGSCPNTCDSLFSSPLALRTELTCSVADGTGEATLLVSGDLVFQLFELTATTVSRLKSLVLHYGEGRVYTLGELKRAEPVFREQQMPAGEQAFFRNCFDPKIVSSELLLACRQVRDPSRGPLWSDQPDTGEQTRSVNLGGISTSTALPPKIFLQGLSFEKVSFIRQSMRLLSLLTKQQRTR